MANNQMMLVCNKCYPNDSDLKYPLDVAYLGKQYPVGSYRTRDNEVVRQRVNEYLDKHAHSEDVIENPTEATLKQNENPVRLTYKTWVRDMPAIKKWEP